MNRVVPIVIFVIIVIIAIAALAFFVRQISHTTVLGQPTPSPVARAAVAEVRLIVQGPIVANEQFVTETLDITAAQRNFTANSTYEDQLVTSQTLSNNTEAYNQLQGALLDAGLTQASSGRNVVARAGSNCPQGLRFTYETAGDGGNTLSSLWASTCGTPNQSMNGNVPLINQLFKAQFPNFNNLTSQFPILQPLQW